MPGRQAAGQCLLTLCSENKKRAKQPVFFILVVLLLVACSYQFIKLAIRS